MSYRHIRQPLPRTVARDQKLLVLFDKGILPKRIAFKFKISDDVVYQAVERRKKFPKFYAELSYGIIRNATADNVKSTA